MKLVILKSFMNGEKLVEVDTDIEVSDEVATELIEKGYAKEVEAPEVKDEDKTEEKPEDDKVEARLNELDTVIKELSDKVEIKQKEQKEVNMSIEVGEVKLSPEKKLSNAAKLAKSLATGNWSEETKAIAGQGETQAADGGALVDTEIVSGIYSSMVASSQIFPLVGKRPVGAGYNSFKIRQLNEANATPADYNGVTLNVIAEGNAISPQKLAYTSDTVEINKLAAVVPFTSEILEDVPGIVQFTEAQVGGAFGMKLDQEVLYGTDSLMTASVGHAGSVAITLADASAPTVAELHQMYSAQINPAASEWYMSGAVYEAINQLEATTATGPVIVPNYAVSPFGTLLGRKVNVVNCMLGANGEAGTIGLCDFANGYLVGLKGGVRMAKSVELYWLTDQEAYRWILRVGGAPTRATTLTLADARIVGSCVFGTDS